MTDATEDPDFDRALKIFRAVRRRTQNGELDWSERTGRMGAYECDLANGNVEVGFADDDLAPPHDFRIYGPSPDYVDVYRLSGRTSPQLQNEIRSLHADVERAALGVEQIMDAMLRELDDEAGAGK